MAIWEIVKDWIKATNLSTIQSINDSLTTITNKTTAKPTASAPQPQVEPIPSASLVIEHIVPRGKGLEFRWWHGKLTRAASRHKGYLRTDLCPPIKGSQLKWYSILHFDCPENLNHWLKSAERETLIEAGREIFKTYQFKSFNTGLEGWFSHQTGSEQIGLGPPAWKQNLAVILGLYPVVMLQSLLFNQFGIMQHWPLASSMLANNLITSSILTWIVMPFVTRLMNFWLQPAHQPMPARTNLLGTAIVVGALGLAMLLFNAW
jgi:antibiotic biosynthesis monooxygenase (ABM) superfamily enzyme